MIGLHYGYSGLFNPSPRYEDLTFTQADYIFNQGGSYLTMSRFKPTDKDFEENFNLNFFTENNVKLLVTVGGDDTASTANRIAKFLEAKHYPIANIHVPKTIDNDLPLPAARRRSATSRPKRAERSSAAPSTTTHARRPTGSS